MDMYANIAVNRNHNVSNGPNYGNGHSANWSASIINHGLVNRREANQYVVKLLDQDTAVVGIDTITMPGNQLQSDVVNERTRIPAYCTHLGSQLYKSADGAASSIPLRLTLQMRRK